MFVAILYLFLVTRNLQLLDKEIKYDLVYPIGSGSIWQDNELRYSIRSFVKYFDQLGKIFIVGQKPEFLNWNNSRLIYIECDDPYRHNKDSNIINKVLRVCQEQTLSDDFLRASDDQIVLRRVNINDFYPRYLIDLNGKQFPKGNSWYKRLEKTIEILKNEKKTTYFYDSHFPNICNKQSFIKVMQNRIQDVTINTYYFNYILDEYKELGKFKLTVQKPILNLNEFQKEVSGKYFLGYNNKGLREPSLLKNWIQNEFYEKSKFEL